MLTALICTAILAVALAGMTVWQWVRAENATQDAFVTHNELARARSTVQDERSAHRSTMRLLDSARAEPDHPALLRRVVVSLRGDAAGIDGVITEDLGDWLRVEQARALPVGMEPQEIRGSILVPADRVDYLQVPDSSTAPSGS